MSDKINLLVTGGCGFIGSNFINHIYDSGQYNIVNFDAMYYVAREENVRADIRQSPDYTLVKGNLRDSAAVERVIAEHDITHIVHFAAQSHVQDSFYDSIKYTEDNIMGTHILLEATRKAGTITRLIHISTDEVYGESQLGSSESQKREYDALYPTNPYAATKAASEMLVNSMLYSFKLPTIITRSNNIYGVNQHTEKLIPQFISRLKQGQRVQVHGDGSMVRSFLHTDDLVRALQLILSQGAVGETYNIKAHDSDEYSVMDIAKMLIELIHDTTDYAQWIEYAEDRPFNDQRYYISGDKMAQLGWQPERTLATSLAELIPHY